MSKDSYLANLQDGLSRRRCPPVVAGRILRETAEHFDDLRAVTGSDDDAQAQLGDPEGLAARHGEAQRHASWWGRHPLTGFGVLPLLAGPVLWILLLAVFMGSGAWLVIRLGYGGSSDVIGDSWNNPAVFPWLWLGTRIADVTALMLITLFFCGRVRRAALDRRWLLLLGGLLGLQGLWFQAFLQPHNFSVAFALPYAPFAHWDWGKGAVPALITVLFWIRSRRPAAPSPSVLVQPC